MHPTCIIYRDSITSIEGIDIKFLDEQKYCNIQSIIDMHGFYFSNKEIKACKGNVHTHVRYLLEKDNKGNDDKIYLHNNPLGIVVKINIEEFF